MAFKLDALIKVVVTATAVWIILGMTMCSCCSYTATDMIRLAFHSAYNLLTGSDEVSIEVKDIRKKTCECTESPWYSPCVIWGSKSAKESGCNKKCNEEKDPLKYGTDAGTCGCAAPTNTDVGEGVSAYVRDNTILPNRCGNRM
jgi:hypothetical protein